MTKSYYIYRIRNKINKNSYIGFTNNPIVRWRNHGYDAKKYPHKPLYKAFKKYGIDNFIFEILFCSTNKDYTLNVMEPYYISLAVNITYHLVEKKQGKKKTT